MKSWKKPLVVECVKLVRNFETSGQAVILYLPPPSNYDNSTHTERERERGREREGAVAKLFQLQINM
jgi:hypothetical protein